MWLPGLEGPQLARNLAAKDLLTSDKYTVGHCKVYQDPCMFSLVLEQTVGDYRFEVTLTDSEESCVLVMQFTWLGK